MDSLLIREVPPWDGSYPLDLDGEPFTYREWGYLKRYGGYLPLTIKQALEGSDPALFLALALIVLRRTGRIDETEFPSVHERFLDAPFDLEQGTSIQLRLEAVEEEDADPPASSNGNTSSSGGRSSENSETAGTRDSATSESLQKS